MSINKEKESMSDYSQEQLIKFSIYQRVGVLVDVQNMFYSAKSLYNAKLNFEKLIDMAVRGRQLIRAICYTVNNPDIDQSGFNDMLKTHGYEVKAKEMRVRADGSVKADWDMGIAIDAINLSEKLDILVLVTGDGDFIDLVKHCQSRGVLVEVISFPKSTNEDLIESADVYTPITEDSIIKKKKYFRRKKS